MNDDRDPLDRGLVICLVIGVIAVFALCIFAPEILNLVIPPRND